MNAELTLSFARLAEGDKRLICVVLSHQCLKTQGKDAIKQLSEEGKHWLIDYETFLLQASKKD